MLFCIWMHYIRTEFFLSQCMYEAAKATLCTHLIIHFYGIFFFVHCISSHSFEWDDKWWALLLLLLLLYCWFFFSSQFFLVDSRTQTQRAREQFPIVDLQIPNMEWIYAYKSLYNAHTEHNVSRALESFWRLQILQHPAPSTSSVSYVRVFQVLDFNYSRSDYNNDNDEKKMYTHTRKCQISLHNFALETSCAYICARIDDDMGSWWNFFYVRNYDDDDEYSHRAITNNTTFVCWAHFWFSPLSTSLYLCSALDVSLVLSFSFSLALSFFLSFRCMCVCVFA